MAPGAGPLSVATAVCLAFTGGWVGLRKEAPGGTEADILKPLTEEEWAFIDEPTWRHFTTGIEYVVPVFNAPPTLIQDEEHSSSEDSEVEEQPWLSMANATVLLGAAILADVFLFVSVVAFLYRRRRQQQISEAAPSKDLGVSQVADAACMTKPLLSQLPGHGGDSKARNLGTASSSMHFVQPVVQPESLQPHADDDDNLAAIQDDSLELQTEEDSSLAAAQGEQDASATFAEYYSKHFMGSSQVESVARDLFNQPASPKIPVQAECSPLSHAPSPCRSLRPGPSAVMADPFHCGGGTLDDDVDTDCVPYPVAM